MCGTTVAAVLESGARCLDAQVRSYFLYSFNATAGDRVSFNASATTFSPQIILLDPSNRERLSALNSSDAPETTLSATIDISGRWTVMLRNKTVGGDGPYSLRMQCSTTEPPPPPPSGFALVAVPPSITISRNQTRTAQVYSTIAGSFNSTVIVQVTGVPAGVTVTPINFAFAPPGAGVQDVTITTSDTAPRGLFFVGFVGTSATGVSDVTSISLSIEAPCVPPFIATQPRSTSAVRGGRALLSVGVDGTPPFTYQWYRGQPGSRNFPMSGGTGPEFFTPSTTEDGVTYWVEVRNECGSKNSAAAAVRFVDPPSRRRAVRP